MPYFGDALAALGDQIDQSLQDLEERIFDIEERLEQIELDMTTDAVDTFGGDDEPTVVVETPSDPTGDMSPEDELTVSSFGLSSPQEPSGPLVSHSVTGMNLLNAESSCQYTLSQDVGVIRIHGQSDISIFIPSHVHVGSVEMNSSARVKLYGHGSVGHIQTYNMCADLSVYNLTLTGNGADNGSTASTLIGCERIKFEQVKTGDQVDGYFVWCDTSRDLQIISCTAHTGGRQSLIRLENVSNSLVYDCDLSSDDDGNYMWRLHATCSNANLVNNDMYGPRGMMIGTHAGDSLDGVRVSDNVIGGTTIATLGMPMDEPSRLRNFTWERNAISQDGIDETPHYMGIRDDWRFG